MGNEDKRWFELGRRPGAGSVVVLSDLHVDRMEPEKLDHLVGVLRGFPADAALVVLGDLADGLHRPGARMELERKAAALLTAFAGFHGTSGPMPLHVPGNHDRTLCDEPLVRGALPLARACGQPVYAGAHGRAIRLSYGDEYDPASAMYRHTDVNNWALLQMFGLERRWWRKVDRWARAHGQRDELLAWLARTSRTAGAHPVFATLIWELAARRLIERESLDVVVMGHTHAARLVRHGRGCYVNAGDWLHHAVISWFDGDGVHQQDLSSAAVRTVPWSSAQERTVMRPRDRRARAASIASSIAGVIPAMRP